ncbi:RNA-directed RNA polymerase L [Bienertia sinuspersici]
MPEYPSYVKVHYAYEDRPRAYSFNGPSNNVDEFGSSGNLESKRKKRVASYNLYAMEGKLKSTFRNSFKWIKSKFYDDYFDV